VFPALAPLVFVGPIVRDLEEKINLGSSQGSFQKKAKIVR
jgi:hypothetical protein